MNLTREKRVRRRRKRNGENPMKKESEIVVSPYFATKNSGNGFPVCVKTKEKMKRKVEGTSVKEYTSVGLRKRVELEPGFLDSINVKHGYNSCGKNINKFNLDVEGKLKSSNRAKDVWDKNRVVSPYFVKKTKTDLIKLRQKKKESVSVRKVSPYVSSSKQADVHLGKVQTEGRKPKIKKLTCRRIMQDITWKPPLLKVKLLQHDHASDTWRVLVICMLLNKTGSLQLKRIVLEFFKLCPNAKRATEILAGDIENVIRTLGFQSSWSVEIQRLSREYLEGSWTRVTDLIGVGKYV